MARKGDNIYLRNTGKWEGRYIKGRTEDGSIRYGYVSGATYDEVYIRRKEAANLYGAKEKEIIDPNRKLLFSTISKEWLKERGLFLKESSIAKYRNILNCYLFPEFGDRYVTDIKKEDLQRYLIKQPTSGGMRGKGLSPQVIKSIVFVFQSVSEYAHNARNLEVVSFGKVAMKDHKKPLRVLSVNEQYKLEQCLLSEINGAGLGIMLCLYTGIRLGELCALKWEDISFANRKLDIRATMTRIQMPGDPKHKTRVIVTPPKSVSSMREIPIPSDMIRLLEGRDSQKDTYFLTGCRKDYMEPRTMENHFKAVIDMCGIENANFHALRHTFATRCIERGFDVKSLSEILGHASVKITLDRYVHPTMELKQKNMEKLSIFMGGQ